MPIDRTWRIAVACADEVIEVASIQGNIEPQIQGMRCCV
jgi:hypothetical protein